MANDIIVKAISGNAFANGNAVTGTNKFGTSDTLTPDVNFTPTDVDTIFHTKLQRRLNANPEVVEEASIIAANSFTSNAKFAKGSFNVSVSGFGSATVTLQRSFDNASNWRDVTTYTADDEQVVENVEDDVLWRIGCKTGEYTSGTIAVRISQ